MRTRCGQKSVSICMAAGLVILIGVRSGWAAAATVRDGLRPLAQDILDVVVKDQHQSAISVGEFVGQARFDTNAGQGIGEDLKSLLEELRPGVVQRGAALTISGRYAFVDEEKQNPQLKIVKVTAVILDQNDHRIDEKSIEIDSTKAIAQVMGVTAALPKDASKVERNRELQKAVAKPQFYLEGTKIRSRAESPYAIEILVKPLENPAQLTAQPRAPQDSAGEAFVDIKQNELYEVKIYNDSGRPVAVALTVDSLDVFHFSNDRGPDGRPQFGFFILQPKGFKEAADSESAPSDGTLTIVGWHKSVAGRENFLSFLVTEHGKGAVSQPGVKARGKVGVIAVQFSECRPLAKGAKAAAGNETGFGPPREVRQKPVRYEVEPPHDFISVRYTRP